MVVGNIKESADVVVIGAGPGGYVAAIKLAQLGKDVTLVEENKIGGVCLNDGCIPSKALIHVAKTLEEIKELECLKTDIEVSSKELQEWKENVVNKLTSGVKLLEEKNDVEIIEGRAKLTSSKEVHINTDEASKTLKFNKCIIATGSKPLEIPGFEFSKKGIIDSKQALKLEEIPEKLLVIGGGYIGMELGTVYQKLGSEVTVIEASKNILPNMDSQAAKVVERRAEELGMKIITGEKAEEAVEKESEIKVKTSKSEYVADKVLVAVGRTPRTENIGLEHANVEKNDKGFIETDDVMKTSNPDIFAIGDVAGQPMLAHVAMHEGKVAAKTISGKTAFSTRQAVPSVVYTDPEVATTGLSEKNAVEKGFEVETGSFSMAANGRAMTMDYKKGFVKLIADKENKTLLGATICGPEASELISELSLGIEMGCLVEDIEMTVHPHPSISEAVMEAAEDLIGRPVHKYKQ